MYVVCSCPFATTRRASDQSLRTGQNPKPGRSGGFPRDELPGTRNVMFKMLTGALNRSFLREHFVLCR